MSIRRGPQYLIEITIYASGPSSVWPEASSRYDRSGGQHISGDVGKLQVNKVLQHRCKGDLRTWSNSGEGELGLSRVVRPWVVSEDDWATRRAGVKVGGHTSIHRVCTTDFNVYEVRVAGIYKE